jgi:DNA-binding FrmR family transcriptional regulator
MDKSQKNTIISLKKAKSSLDNVIKMVEDSRYCVDIMQQNLAVIGLLKSAHQKLMENHLQTCFKNAMSSNNETLKAKMVKEILAVDKLASR